LRDGDRFFYGNNPALAQIQSLYGIDFHTSMAQIIARDTDTPAADIHSNMFITADDDLPAASCSVIYTVPSTSTGNFQVGLSITNTSSTPVNNWAVRFQYASGQRVGLTWNALSSQTGANVTLNNAALNATIPPGGSITDAGFNATFDNATNPMPVNFTLNNKRCAVSGTAPPVLPPAPGVGTATGIGGKCIDAAGANPANGTAVQLFTCNGTNAQRWTNDLNSDGTLRALGKCMDVTSAGTANGTQVQLFDCNGTAAQKWNYSAGRLINTNSGRCLDATGQSSADTTRLQIWTCTGNANQSWTLHT